jgi:hypothetical protein
MNRLCWKGFVASIAFRFNAGKMGYALRDGEDYTEGFAITGKRACFLAGFAIACKDLGA